MTKEDILKLADNQGLFDYFDLEGDSVGQLMLYTLALDCMDAEREACAAILDANADKCVPSSTFMQLLRSNAAAIRARGQK